MTTLLAYATVPLLHRRTPDVLAACAALVRLNRRVKTEPGLLHTVYSLKARLTKALVCSGYCAGVALELDGRGPEPRDLYLFAFHVPDAAGVRWRCMWHQPPSDCADYVVRLQAEALPFPPMLVAGQGDAGRDVRTVRAWLRYAGG